MGALDARREQDDGHQHGHEHGHQKEHHHEHPTGLLGRFKELVAPHSHDSASSLDNELEASSRGLRALTVSLVLLGLTALVQAGVVLLTGSVALLGDTLHNVADALTAVPLAIAFTLSRRPPNRRYTYGYGRSEDLAGIVVVLFIVASAVLVAWESAHRLVDPGEVKHLGAVAAAGVVGFLGNEVVARYRMKVGREIGSAALVADGLHARTDALTSLAVVASAVGVWLGWDQADPVVGLLITLAILKVLVEAGRQVYHRLMDAVDPSLVDEMEQVLRSTPGVRSVGELHVRWIGHSLRAECEVVVDASITLAEAHAIALEAEHRMLHQVRRLSSVFIHADPEGPEHHALTAHHL